MPSPLTSTTFTLLESGVGVLRPGGPSVVGWTPLKSPFPGLR